MSLFRRKKKKPEQVSATWFSDLLFKKLQERPVLMASYAASYCRDAALSYEDRGPASHRRMLLNVWATLKVLAMEPVSREDFDNLVAEVERRYA